MKVGRWTEFVSHAAPQLALPPIVKGRFRSSDWAQGTLCGRALNVMREITARTNFDTGGTLVCPKPVMVEVSNVRIDVEVGTKRITVYCFSSSIELSARCEFRLRNFPRGLHSAKRRWAGSGTISWYSGCPYLVMPDLMPLFYFVGGPWSHCKGKFGHNLSFNNVLMVHTTRYSSAS